MNRCYYRKGSILSLEFDVNESYEGRKFVRGLHKPYRIVDEENTSSIINDLYDLSSLFIFIDVKDSSSAGRMSMHVTLCCAIDEPAELEAAVSRVCILILERLPGTYLRDTFSMYGTAIDVCTYEKVQAGSECTETIVVSAGMLSRGYWESIRAKYEFCRRPPAYILMSPTLVRHYATWMVPDCMLQEDMLVTISGIKIRFTKHYGESVMVIVWQNKHDETTAETEEKDC